MKKPYIVNYMEEHDLVVNSGIYYDTLTQISYIDSNKKQRAIDKGCEDTLNTRSVENSDPDELYIVGGTKQTFTMEVGDPDECCIVGETRITKSIEDNDPDEMYLFGGTKVTATIEDSDPDELAFFC